MKVRRSLTEDNDVVVMMIRSYIFISRTSRSLTHSFQKI
jgi:hypothetical protein